tara:strand:- start:51 stop:221 length:171 start_codon:yes stop_codon:yes gene_type:complete
MNPEKKSKTAMAMSRWFIFMVVIETFYRRWKTLSKAGSQEISLTSRCRPSTPMAFV